MINGMDENVAALNDITIMQINHSDAVPRENKTRVLYADVEQDLNNYRAEILSLEKKLLRKERENDVLLARIAELEGGDK